MTFNRRPRFLPAGDRALTVEFGNEISEEINNAVINLTSVIENEALLGIEEIVPTYRSILVYYDPLHISLVELKNKIMDLIIKSSNLKARETKLYTVPVVYGDEFGPDLLYVANYNNLREEDVIKLHTSVDYKIYMIGFAPGFPYLGGMPKSIATPRLATPRKLVKAGSVGIAGEQTGIYSIDDPGGWRIIGRTPLQIYNPKNNPPVLFKAGDYIRFKSISKEEYEEIKDKIISGSYILECNLLNNEVSC